MASRHITALAILLDDVKSAQSTYNKQPVKYVTGINAQVRKDVTRLVSDRLPSPHSTSSAQLGRLESQSASGYVDRDERYVHPTKLGRMTTRQIVHRLLRNCEPVYRPIHSQDVDGRASVSHRVTRAALRRVVARDGVHSTKVGEVGKRAQVGIVWVLGLETVRPVRTGDVIEGETSVVVGGVVGECRYVLCEDVETGEYGDKDSDEMVHCWLCIEYWASMRKKEWFACNREHGPVLYARRAF